jgi:hypothetical protein
LALQVKTVLAGPPHFSAHPKGSIEATEQKPGPGPADQGRVVQRVRACLHVVTRGGSPGCWTADRPGFLWQSSAAWMAARSGAPSDTLRGSRVGDGRERLPLEALGGSYLPDRAAGELHPDHHCGAPPSGFLRSPLRISAAALRFEPDRIGRHGTTAHVLLLVSSWRSWPASLTTMSLAVVPSLYPH